MHVSYASLVHSQNHTHTSAYIHTTHLSHTHPQHTPVTHTSTPHTCHTHIHTTHLLHTHPHHTPVAHTSTPHTCRTHIHTTHLSHTQAEHRESGKQAALKRVPIQDESELDDFMVEIDILAECKHSYIVGLYEAFFYDQALWVSDHANDPFSTSTELAG